MSFFYHYIQQYSNDCGATCLRMVARFHGLQYTSHLLRIYCGTIEKGASVLGISNAATAIGFNTLTAKLTIEQLSDKAPLPCILHWNNQHFVTLYDVIETDGELYFIVADPALKDMVRHTVRTIEECWLLHSDQNGQRHGIAILLEPFDELLLQLDTEQRLNIRPPVL